MAIGGLNQVLQQFRRGTYTNDPRQPNYSNHFASLRPATEPIVAVYPGTAVAAGGLLRPRQMVNIVQTPQYIYVDTPRVSHVGPVASLAGSLLRGSGMTAPMSAPLANVQLTPTSANRLAIHGPTLPAIQARTNGFVGRPSDLSGIDQIRNLGRMFRR